MSVAYTEFVDRKRQMNTGCGFEPLWIPDWMHDFQKYLAEWAIAKGRAATFADCGMGKTPLQLVWAENVVRKTGKPVLLLTPLAVSHQTQREAEKFGMVATRCADGKHSGGIVITNYERLHYFNADDFSGVVCDESSAIKSFDSKRKDMVTAFMRRTPYRSLYTATAAPNDFWELGTSSEALGYLGWRDMITTFFKQETSKDHLGWGRTKYRFRGHAERPFWQWVCSWARAIRKPSDLGFDDGAMQLPPLNEREVVVKAHRPLNGQLFSLPAGNMQEQREERRSTIRERCEMVAEKVDAIDGRPAVVWCHLNDEGDMLEKLIPDAVQVSGGMTDDEKESRLLAFSCGDIRVLVTKPKIGCWGLNWQHCSDVFTFPSHSFEQYYQSIRRCWRYGQVRPVDVTIVTTEGEERVMDSLRRKAEQADIMFRQIVECMSHELRFTTNDTFEHTEEVPSWL